MSIVSVNIEQLLITVALNVFEAIFACLFHHIARHARWQTNKSASKICFYPTVEKQNGLFKTPAAGPTRP